jgi:hypothetical protein
MKTPIAIAVVAALATAATAPAPAQSNLPLTAQTSVLSQNVTDLWWDPAQSGWGLALYQSGAFVYAVLFVYDQNNHATWYPAELQSQGNGVYSGPIYTTTGPWFGAGNFNASAVGRQQVGTMTITMQGNGSAIVSYTISGQNVTRTLVRQTFTNADLTGTFTAQSTLTATNCSSASNNGTVNGTSHFTVTDTGGNNRRITWQNPNGGTCTFNGTATQSGRFASMSNSTYSCTSGETGTVNFPTLSSVNGVFSGQVSGSNNSSGCTYSGGFGGLNTLSTFSQ